MPPVYLVVSLEPAFTRSPLRSLCFALSSSGSLRLRHAQILPVCHISVALTSTCCHSLVPSAFVCPIGCQSLSHFLLSRSGSWEHRVPCLPELHYHLSVRTPPFACLSFCRDSLGWDSIIFVFRVRLLRLCVSCRSSLSVSLICNPSSSSGSLRCRLACLNASVCLICNLSQLPYHPSAFA